MNSRLRELPTWRSIFVFVFSILILLYPLLTGRTIFWRLPSLQFYPWRQLAFSELRAGRLAFWNPYLGGGAPLIANYQTAIFYPPNWLHLVVPDTTAMNLLALFHLFWAGLGMWQFTRKLELSQFGRSISVLCFALGLYHLGNLQELTLLSATAWVPWLFWATYRTLEGRRMRDVGILALFTGLQLLAGHAQVVWYGLLSLGVFVLWHVGWNLSSEGRRTRLTALSLWTASMILGAGIASGQLFLTLEYLASSHRPGGVDYETLTTLSYAPWRILNLVSPSILGNPGDGTYLDKSQLNYYENTIYIGILPLIAVIFAVQGWLKYRPFIAHHPVYRSTPFWVFLSILGYGLALGRYNPFYPFLFNFVPTFGAFREPVRWLMLPAFGLSVLAGIGVHNWQQSLRSLTRLRLTTVGMLGFITFLLAAAAILEIDSRILRNLARSLGALAVWIVGSALLTLWQPRSQESTKQLFRWQTAVLVFVAADLIWANMGINPTVPRAYFERDYSVSQPEGRLYWFEDYEARVRNNKFFVFYDYRGATDRWAEIRTSLLPNLSMTNRVRLFNNYDPLQPAVHRRYVELIEALQAKSGPLLQAAGVGKVYGMVLPAGWEGQGSSFTTPSTPPIARMVPEAIVVDSQDAAEPYLTSATWNPEQKVILNGEDLPVLVNEAPFTEATVVSVATDSLNALRFRVTSNGGGYLVVANTWYPGWKVRVDGEPAQLYQANIAFQAVFVPAGGADVIFTYTPTTATVGLLVSGVSIFVAVLLVALGIFRYEADTLKLLAVSTS